MVDACSDQIIITTDNNVKTLVRTVKTKALQTRLRIILSLIACK